MHLIPLHLFSPSSNLLDWAQMRSGRTVLFTPSQCTYLCAFGESELCILSPTRILLFASQVFKREDSAGRRAHAFDSKRTHRRRYRQVDVVLQGYAEIYTPTPQFPATLAELLDLYIRCLRTRPPHEEIETGKNLI